MNLDLEIHHEIVAELNGERALRSDRITVVVLDGVATLSGEVGSYSENLAPESSKVVQAEIEAALDRCALEYARLVKVQVVGSNVTLSGRVSSWSERELAKQAAWASPGVLKVIDQMSAST